MKKKAAPKTAPHSNRKPDRNPDTKARRVREVAVPLPASSSLLRDEVDDAAAERQAASQRDSEPDDFDIGTNVADDRVRGAGGQSLAELVIAKEQGWGLDEHGGGLRFDQPEPNVNDYDVDETSDLAVEALGEEVPEETPQRKSRIA